MTFSHGGDLGFFLIFVTMNDSFHIRYNNRKEQKTQKKKKDFVVVAITMALTINGKIHLIHKTN